MGSRLSGCGGFINISQNAKKVFFYGTFTAKGLEIAAGGGELKIIREGEVKKIIKKVQHITYSGTYAAETGQQAFYLTERAVFALKRDGLHLIEIAPGIDIEKDILAHMEFAPVIPMQPKSWMPAFSQMPSWALAGPVTQSGPPIARPSV